MKRWKKGAVLLAACVLAFTIFNSTAYANAVKKTIEVYYNNIKVMYNGQTVSIASENEPFTLNGTTYLPLRAVGEALDKNVSWDHNAKIVYLSDKAPQVDQKIVTELNDKIYEQNLKIIDLEEEITKLKKELDEKNKKIEKLEDGSGTLKDLEKDLNKDYSRYRNAYLDIALSGNKNNIDVEIDIKDADWRDLGSRYQEYLIEDIVDDILAKFKNAKIKGKVVDGRKSLTTFETDSKGKVKFKGSSSSIRDLEDDLNYDFGRYERKTLNISLTENSSSIYAVIDIYEDDWDDLSRAKKFDLLEKIVKEIQREYPRTDIQIDIKDGNKQLNYYDVDRNGSAIYDI